MGETRYKEIFRLQEMLENANIQHMFTNNSAGDRYESYQISIYDENMVRLVSVIQGRGTYGAEDNKLEIMGLLKEGETSDDVVGWLTAEDVFDRIKAAVFA